MNKNLVVGTVATVCVGLAFIGCSSRAKQADPAPAPQQQQQQPKKDKNPPANEPAKSKDNGKDGLNASDAQRFYDEFKDMVAAIGNGLELAFTHATKTIEAFRDLSKIPAENKDGGQNPARADARQKAEKLRDELNRVARQMHKQVDKLMKVDLDQLPKAVETAAGKARNAVEKKQKALDQVAELLTQKSSDKGAMLDQAQKILNNAKGN